RIAERADRLRALAVMPLTVAERLRLASTAVARSLREFPPLQRPAVRDLLRRSSRAALPSHALDHPAAGGGAEAAARRLIEEAVARGASAAWTTWVAPFVVLLILDAACAAGYRSLLAAFTR